MLSGWLFKLGIKKDHWRYLSSFCHTWHGHRFWFWPNWLINKLLYISEYIFWVISATQRSLYGNLLQPQQAQWRRWCQITRAWVPGSEEARKWALKWRQQRKDGKDWLQTAEVKCVNKWQDVLLRWGEKRQIGLELCVCVCECIPSFGI